MDYPDHLMISDANKIFDKIIIMVIIDILSPLLGGDSNIMKFLKSTNYALHTILFLTRDTSNKLFGVQELAEK